MGVSQYISLSILKFILVNFCCYFMDQNIKYAKSRSIVESSWRCRRVRADFLAIFPCILSNIQHFIPKWSILHSTICFRVGFLVTLRSLKKMKFYCFWYPVDLQQHEIPTVVKIEAIFERCKKMQKTSTNWNTAFKIILSI